MTKRRVAKREKFRVGQVVAYRSSKTLSRVLKVFTAGKGLYRSPSIRLELPGKHGWAQVEILQSDVRPLTARERGKGRQP